jgi:hypothetical protein
LCNIEIQFIQFVLWYNLWTKCDLLVLIVTGYRKVLVIDLRAWYSFHMKNALLLPLVFLLNLIVWVAGISFFSVLSVTRYFEALISGKNQLFVVAFLERSAYLFPLGCIFGLLAVFFFFMRHKTQWFYGVPLIVLLACLSLFFAIPYSYRVQDWLNSKISRFPLAEASEILASGYIRSDSSNGLFFWYDLENNPTSNGPREIVTADVSNPEDVLSVSAFSYDLHNTSLQSPSRSISVKADGSDPLFAEFRTVPVFFEPFVTSCVEVLGSFFVSFKTGVRSYLWIVGSFLLAVSVLCFLCFATSWRMLNVFLVLFSTSFLFWIHQYTNGRGVLSILSRLLPRSIPAGMISPLSYIAFSIVVTFISLIVMLYRFLRKTRSEAWNG